jgi:zinc transporter ZupT
MDSKLLQVIVFAAVAGFGNVLGGLVLFPKSFRLTPYLKYLLAIGAGFMLSVAVIEVLPQTIALWIEGDQDAEALFAPMALMLSGYLLTQFVEHTIAPHFHLGEEMHCDDEYHAHDELSTRSLYAAITGLLVHTFFDGITIGAAAAIDSRVGLLVFLAVLLHKLPEGFTVGSMVLASGRKRRFVTLATALLGATTLVGALAFYLVGSHIDGMTKFTLPVAAGVTLYVAASDLIPEVNHHAGSPVKVSVAILAGIGLFFLAHTALHSVVHSH